MRPTLMLLLGVLLLACSAERAGETPDAGSCPEGEVRGPLGSCVPSCDRCEADGDCGADGLCVTDNGCRVCRSRFEQRPDGGFCARGGQTCRLEGDCCSAMTCRGPDDPPLCGICRRVLDECADDASCGEGALCVEQPSPPCACSPGTFRACVATCQQAGCPQGERCTTGGKCEPVPCTDGFLCRPSEDCRPGAEADRHGCAPHPCLADEECSGGVCLDGRCHAGGRTCQFLPD